MGMKRSLLLIMLLAVPASADVHVTVSPGPLPADALKRTEDAAARLLEAPVRAPGEGALAFTAASWKRDLPLSERAALLRALQMAWGPRLVVREDAAVPAPAMTVPASALDVRARTDAMRARLDGSPRPLERAGQDRFYDGSLAVRGSAVAAGPFAPAPAARVAMTASAPRFKSAPPPPPAQTAAAPISWKRAGVEVLKGAGQTIAAVFTWKGLAVAAASIALVSVAPVAIYGLLALGAAFGGYTIGKALVSGTKAYKSGDAEGFYAASREMGRGTLALGLTLLGARHAPTNFRPHFPRTSGEWRAMAAAVDDEPIVAMSILRGKSDKP